MQQFDKFKLGQFFFFKGKERWRRIEFTELNLADRYDDTTSDCLCPTEFESNSPPFISIKKIVGGLGESWEREIFNFTAHSITLLSSF